VQLPLRALRLRLTAWYVGSFTAILLVVGFGIYWVTAREVEAQLGRTLRGATDEMVRASGVAESEGVPSGEAARRAVEVIAVPGSDLYLFDDRGVLLSRGSPRPPVRRAAADALRTGAVDGSFEAAGGVWRMHARRFSLRDGSGYAAVAVADLKQVEAQSLRLIETFVAGAFVALLLVAVVGHRLVEITIRPAQAAYEEMRRFLADAAHELRTPVAVLRARAEVSLQRERAPDEYRTALDEVGREAEVMGRIVDDLLILARVETGVRAVMKEPVYLDDLVSGAAASAGVLAESRGVRLEVGEFDEAAITGDPALLRQLLLILLQNAVKYTPRGGAVRVDVHSRGGAPTVVVEDTGMGIAPGELPHVFERFYRGEEARGVTEGAGLGLSIARRIVAGHGGRIEVRSEPGRGTRVTVTFPPGGARGG
jgi:signal transduction histidine kinase